MNDPWKNLSGKHNYYIGYLDYFAHQVGYAFEEMCKTPCNIYYVLDSFLAGSVFEAVHELGNPKYLNMSHRQLIECISYDDKLIWWETKPVEEVDWTIAWWVGNILAIFQWRYSIDFRDWLKYFSTKDVFNMYYPLHEASFQNASEKLYEMYRTSKRKNLTRNK
ncbi:MAG: hypothetical protein IJ593_04370 [Lachnospiraceae bacterium]|nr:hypothetical protein [Lachnospiraceae bacterium]